MAKTQKVVNKNQSPEKVEKKVEAVQEPTEPEAIQERAEPEAVQEQAEPEAVQEATELEAVQEPAEPEIIQERDKEEDQKKKLIARTYILHDSRQYKPGEQLPANKADMVTAWIEAGTAVWVNENEESE